MTTFEYIRWKQNRSLESKIVKRIKKEEKDKEREEKNKQQEEEKQQKLK
jgi:hypothetical protein